MTRVAAKSQRVAICVEFESKSGLFLYGVVIRDECYRRLVRKEYEVKQMLDKLRNYETQEGHLIDEMYGEIYTLEWLLEERDDLF